MTSTWVYSICMQSEKEVVIKKETERQTDREERAEDGNREKDMKHKQLINVHNIANDTYSISDSHKNHQLNS
jgi:hypothetical protein